MILIDEDDEKDVIAPQLVAEVHCNLEWWHHTLNNPAPVDGPYLSKNSLSNPSASRGVVLGSQWLIQMVFYLSLKNVRWQIIIFVSYFGDYMTKLLA